MKLVNLLPEFQILTQFGFSQSKENKSLFNFMELARSSNILIANLETKNSKVASKVFLPRFIFQEVFKILNCKDMMNMSEVCKAWYVEVKIVQGCFIEKLVKHALEDLRELASLQHKKRLGLLDLKRKKILTVSSFKHLKLGVHLLSSSEYTANFKERCESDLKKLAGMMIRYLVLEHELLIQKNKSQN